MSQWATVENEKRFGDFNPSFMEVDRGQTARKALEGLRNEQHKNPICIPT